MKKFDYVIGNPPYHEKIKGRSEEPPVYHFFYDSAIKISNYTMLITLSRFIFDAGKTPSKWNKKMLNSPHFKVHRYYPIATNVFPTTDIKGGVAITSWNNLKNYEPIKIFYPNKEIRFIVKKVKNISEYFFNKIIYSNTSYKYNQSFYKENPDFKNRVSGGSRRYITSSAFDKFPEVFINNRKDSNHIGIIGRQDSKRTTKYINKKYINPPENFEYYKLVIPSSSGSGIFGEKLSDPFVGKPFEGYTETFVTFGCFDTYYEALSSLKYIKSKFARAMLNSRKITQGNKNSKVWSNVPIEDFTENSDIDWSKPISEIDLQLYKKYGLDKSEINFIEKNIEEMD